MDGYAFSEHKILNVRLRRGVAKDLPNPYRILVSYPVRTKQMRRIASVQVHASQEIFNSPFSRFFFKHFTSLQMPRNMESCLFSRPNTSHRAREGCVKKTNPPELPSRSSIGLPLASPTSCAPPRSWCQSPRLDDIFFVVNTMGFPYVEGFNLGASGGSAGAEFNGSRSFLRRFSIVSNWRSLRIYPQSDIPFDMRMSN
jgi:hypothetical protein